MTSSTDLHEHLFGEPEAAAAFTPVARLQSMLDVEVALAEAEADAGAIPASCLPHIRAAAHADQYDAGAIARDAALAGNVAIPLIRQLRQQVAALDAEASRHVHRGATSQDIIDTGLVLQLRRAVPVVTGHLESAARSAAGLARSHMDTPMPGRTWLQQATPTTFGLKAAGWLDIVERARGNVAEALDRALVVQLGGASGTLAALGERGLAVAGAFGRSLALPVPDTPWHTHRDRLAHLACALGVTCGSLGKIGRDVALLAQTEVAEAFEAPVEGRGGSSSMPHKRNPVAAATAVAAAVRAPGLVATMLAAMPQEHERGFGGWQAEWDTLPDLVVLTAGAARAVSVALAGLAVDPGRMRVNLEAAGGVALAEALAAALADHVGQAESLARVERACRRAERDGRPLREVAAETAEIVEHVSAADIANILSPRQYLGSAHEFVERVLQRWKR